MSPFFKPHIVSAEHQDKKQHAKSVEVGAFCPVLFGVEFRPSERTLKLKIFKARTVYQ